MEEGGPGDSKSSILGLGHMTFASKQTKSKAGEDHGRGSRGREVLWNPASGHDTAAVLSIAQAADYLRHIGSIVEQNPRPRLSSRISEQFMVEKGNVFFSGAARVKAPLLL